MQTPGDYRAVRKRIGQGGAEESRIKTQSPMSQEDPEAKSVIEGEIITCVDNFRFFSTAPSVPVNINQQPVSGTKQ